MRGGRCLGRRVHGWWRFGWRRLCRVRWRAWDWCPFDCRSGLSYLSTIIMCMGTDVKGGTPPGSQVRHPLSLKGRHGEHGQARGPAPTSGRTAARTNGPERERKEGGFEAAGVEQAGGAEHNVTCRTAAFTIYCHKYVLEEGHAHVRRHINASSVQWR